ADRNRSHWSTSKTPSYTKSVSWQHHHKLQPGIYKNMGSNSVNIIINNTRKIIPPGKVFTLRGGTLNINIPGRSALLLGKTGEPPNYLYL
ncbi:hypothetical protein, partial [Escherichia coli]|uniref:hypothetical protein n=1 Tax=Escherichia coli TaxID=562 RepID=UPI001FF64B77